MPSSACSCFCSQFTFHCGFVSRTDISQRIARPLIQKKIKICNHEGVNDCVCLLLQYFDEVCQGFHSDLAENI